MRSMELSVVARGEKRRVARVEVRSQPWFKEEDYPFESRYLEVPGGRLHYVDEGREHEQAVVFVHGTPSFSYEFREQIRALRGQWRCVALDHLGFGLSERPVCEPLEGSEAGFRYSLEDHGANLKRLVDALGLERFTLVVHDFGGPIGCSLLLEDKGRVEKLVVLNSWAWPMDNDPKFVKGRRYLDSGLTRFLYLRLNFSARYMVKASWGARRPLSPEVRRRFMAMFPNKASRLGTWGFARSLVRENSYFERLYEQVKAGGLEGVPALVIWGKADAMVGLAQLERWREVLPEARFVELSDVGHFPQEEAAQEVSELLSEFLS